MRKKLATKICAIVMTAAMVAGMAGCGGDDGGNSSQQGGNTGNDNKESSETPSKSDEQPGGVEDNTPDDQQADTQKYDFGGAVVRVSGGPWNALNPANEGKPNYDTGWERAHAIEEKYGITIQYVELVDDGYGTKSSILAGLDAGECYADIFEIMDDVFIGLKGYLADVTDTIDQLEVGSIYLEPATWNGHVYGLTFDNMGSSYVIGYSRSYLESIGMDVTPTDMFVQGKWDYANFEQYLTDLKAKLPDGTYPVSIDANGWASMAPAANGVISVTSDGTINLTDERYIEALEEYSKLLELGLACPIENVNIDEESGGISYSEHSSMDNDMSGPTEAKAAVMLRIQAWQYDYINVGDWGIVPFPWGSTVTVDESKIGQDDCYTTLSDNYLIPQSIWTNTVTPKAEFRGAGAKDIPDIVLLMIAKDMRDANSPDGAKVMHDTWVAEQKGEKYENYGFSPNTAWNFSTEQDIEVYDWMHTRSAVDWGSSMQYNGLVRVIRNAYYVIAAGRDARSTGESFKSQGEAALADFNK